MPINLVLLFRLLFPYMCHTLVKSSWGGNRVSQFPDISFALCTCAVCFCWIVSSAPSSAHLSCEIALSSGTSCRSRVSVRVPTPDSMEEMSGFAAMLKETFLAFERWIKQSFLWEVLVQSSLCLVGVSFAVGMLCTHCPVSSIQPLSFLQKEVFQGEWSILLNQWLLWDLILPLFRVICCAVFWGQRYHCSTAVKSKYQCLQRWSWYHPKVKFVWDVTSIKGKQEVQAMLWFGVGSSFEWGCERQGGGKEKAGWLGARRKMDI